MRFTGVAAMRIPAPRAKRAPVKGYRDAGRLALSIVGFAGVYAIVGRVGLAIAPVHVFASLVWATTGLALAVLLRRGLQLWPGVALGAFLANTWTGAPVPVALGISAGNTAAAVLGAYSIRRVAGRTSTLARLPDVLAFIVFGALLSSTVSASVGVSSLLAAGLVPRPDVPGTWAVWWLGDAVGALVIGSLALAWSATRQPAAGARRRAEAAALAAVLMAATLLVFLRPPAAAPTSFLQASLLIPLLTWAAVRFAVRGATAAILLASAIAVAGTAQGLGPFALEPLPRSLLHEQVFIAIVATAVLVMGAVTAERAAALEVLRGVTEAERRSAGLLRTLADSIPDPVFAKDDQSRLLYANPATLEAIGKPAQEVLGRSDREFFDDEETGRVIVENDRQLMTAGEAMTVEERVESPSGRRWFLSTKAPVRDQAGKVTGLIGVTRDITARKRAEEALRQSEERFRAFVTASSDVVYRMSPDWSEMRELDGREFIADTDAPNRGWLEKYIHPDDHPKVLAGIDEAIRTRNVFQLEHRVRRVDGTLGWTFSRAVPLLDANGAVVEWIGAAIDITQRKRAEEALRESEERFRLLVQGVRDCAIYMLAPDGTVTSWSAAAEQMFGYRDDEIIRQHRRIFFNEEQRAAGLPQRELEKAAATGHCEEEAWRVRKDGSRFWANVLVTALRDDGGEVRGFVNVTRDFTERKRAHSALRDSEERLRASEAALREADRQKNRFLAMLSHELRNPLAPIRNALYVLDRAAPGGEQARRAQAILHRQVGLLTWLVDDLLDVTRIAHGKIRLQRERLELNEVARRAVEDHRAVFARSELRLELLPAAAEVWVDADRVRLAQVIGNLVQNAAKFTPRAGKVTVSVDSSPASGQASLTVRDTGKGIEPEMLPRLFQAFIQAESTLDRSRGGLGLGLALVKGLVEAHGGSVTAASEGLGKGAAFTITLPLEVTAPRTIPAVSARGAITAPRRVLVIDDDEDAAAILREVLELDQHVVEVAGTGREGLEKAQAFHPDVVLCDIGLPELDGYEVARTMRADPALGSVGLIALSGYAQPEDVEMAREAGFDAHVAKPPSTDTLARALAEVGNTRHEHHAPA
jgi:PAS domain S-box-containing protein